MRSLFLPIVVLFILPSAALADPPVTGESATRSLAPVGMPIAASDKPWSVVGIWNAVHTTWKNTVTFAPDGSLLNSEMKLDGRWTLTTQQGQLQLIIQWQGWPAETVSMVNANEFYGTDGSNELRLRRNPTAAVSVGGQGLGDAVEFHSWHQGDPAVKLIRQDEGFCALTSVTGHFVGSGELVKVYVAEDGYWYLGGHSRQNDVAAECM